jgi:hypothetical protein
VVPPRRAVDFAAVERLRLVVERDELRDVPDLARVVPEVDRERVPVVDRRGVAARARETASSVAVSSPTVSVPKRSGIRPGVPIDSGVNVCSPIDSDGLCSSSGSGVKLGSPKPTESSSRLSPSK